MFFKASEYAVAFAIFSKDDVGEYGRCLVEEGMRLLETIAEVRQQELPNMSVARHGGGLRGGGVLVLDSALGIRVEVCALHAEQVNAFHLLCQFLEIGGIAAVGVAMRGLSFLWHIFYNVAERWYGMAQGESPNGAFVVAEHLQLEAIGKAFVIEFMVFDRIVDMAARKVEYTVHYTPQTEGTDNGQRCLTSAELHGG